MAYSPIDMTAPAGLYARWPKHQRDVLRTDVGTAAANLLAAVQRSCTGSAEVVRVADMHFMGPVEQRGDLASRPGYVTVTASPLGDSYGEEIYRIKVAVWGEYLRALDLADYAEVARESIERNLRAKAEAAGLDPEIMVDATTGERHAMGDIAQALLDRAIAEQTSPTHHGAITVKSLVWSAMQNIKPEAFTATIAR